MEMHFNIQKKDSKINRTEKTNSDTSSKSTNAQKDINNNKVSERDFDHPRRN